MSRKVRRIISKGSQGTAVKKLQRKLKIGVDGDFGPATAKAVRQWKRRNGRRKLDAVVRPAMWRELGFEFIPAPPVGALQGSPEAIINRVIWDAQRRGFPNYTPASVRAANGRHGPTINGGRSDHQGPGNTAWAADLSNASHPTKEMDAYAARLARKFHLDWDGSGVATTVEDGYRTQMLYRTNVGGNHHNHIHLGIRKL